MAIVAKRCTLDMTHCEDFNSLSISSICDRFNDKNMLWTNFITAFKPPLKCPIKMVSNFLL